MRARRSSRTRKPRPGGPRHRAWRRSAPVTPTASGPSSPLAFQAFLPMSGPQRLRVERCDVQALSQDSTGLKGVLPTGPGTAAIAEAQLVAGRPGLILQAHSCMASITGWYDPTPKGGAVRLAAHGYLPSPRAHGVRLTEIRRGDLVVLEDGRVQSVNGLAPEDLAHRPEFGKLGAVHPKRMLRLETPEASSQRTADIQRVMDLVCPLGFGQRALIVSPPQAGKTMMLQAVAEGVALSHPDAVLLLLLVDE